MKKKVTIWGIGPKLIITAVPYFSLASFLSSRFPHIFMLSFIPQFILKSVGGLLLLLGIVFFINTQKVFLREFKKGNLMTTGTYSICRNPIYATFIVFVVPSIAILENSWLAITTSILMYFVFKANIGKEYEYLRDKFGYEYIEYEKRINEILPIPKINKKK